MTTSGYGEKVQNEIKLHWLSPKSMGYYAWVDQGYGNGGGTIIRRIWPFCHPHSKARLGVRVPPA
ncbi:hypothetical protein T265_04615 [Opisthorchis viverrini]|uniref:Uncharacterized protein n=1 Tax=Opisthorchis viverrini TaxID=6198 RepID=A0A074ZZ22_OPIVI|nr:hypothetical protein T265_04615 [Opisthorchis viverrini]KER28570.1 hypothetical protein T265_04615 [Opisthorchis viverrini]